jgi:hypothetical protein
VGNAVGAVKFLGHRLFVGDSGEGDGAWAAVTVANSARSAIMKRRIWCMVNLKAQYRELQNTQYRSDHHDEADSKRCPSKATVISRCAKSPYLTVKSQPNPAWFATRYNVLPISRLVE